MSNFPLVSVVLVNFNGKKFLNNCLNSIFDNKYKNYEVIVVDNNSQDGSIEKAIKNFGSSKKLRIIKNVKNTGPAGGLNLGAMNANGKYIAILGYDTKVDKNWLIEYVNFMEKEKDVGIAQGKLMRMDEKNRFCYVGDFLGPFGFLIERARSAIDEGQFNEVCEIFSINSATMIVRKDLFDKLEGFYEEFFMYLEETDLCFRTHLFGKKVMFLPSSIVYHHDSTKLKKEKKLDENFRNYLGSRNYIWTLIRNLGVKNLIIKLPIHLSSWIVIGIMLLVKGETKRSCTIWKALGWHIINFGKVWKSRYFVQKNIRKVGDNNFEHLFSSKSLSYYFGKAWAYVNKKPF